MDLGEKVGQTIPTACENWPAAKAAYRFIDNSWIDEYLILKGHSQATKSRFIQTSGPVLVIQDTTVFSFRRNKPGAIGQTHLIAINKE